MSLGPFGNNPLPPSIASQSLPYKQATQIYIPEIRANGPARVAALYAAFQAAITLTNSTVPPTPAHVEAQQAAQAAYNQAAHALFWDFPNYFNAITAWYENFGTKAVGSPADPVPGLPADLYQFLS